MYDNPTDPFARLRAIQSGETTNSVIRHWNYENDGDIIGTIVGFSELQIPKYGKQHTAIIKLADTNELVSAFVNAYLQEGLRRQKAEVGDLILIQFLGKEPQGFNRFRLEIEKPQPPRPVEQQPSFDRLPW